MVQLYLRLIGARIRAQMQYRISFLFEMFSFALITAIELVAIATLIYRFGDIGGWSGPEIMLLYGISVMSLGLAEMIARGFDAPFELHMIRGTFDGILMRPLGAFFQILASEFQLRRLGRVFQGLLAVVYGWWQLQVEWRWDGVLAVGFGLVSGTLIQMGIFVIGATLCFWTNKSLEAVNLFTNGGDFLNNYPFGIYARPVRFVFLAIVPLGVCGYPAVLWLLRRSDPLGLPATVVWFSPLIATGFCIAAYSFWRFGVTKYQSSGS